MTKITNIIITALLFILQSSQSLIYPVYNTFRSSYELAKKLSQIGCIDNSHNHEHSKEVLFWSIEIIERLPYQLTQLELSMIGECALLHDFMDSKYMNFKHQVRSHLSLYYKEEDVNIMMNIMKTMSYSKIVLPDGTVCFPEWVEMSPFSHVFHVVREADLLSSYNIARMIEFRIYNQNHQKKIVLLPKQSMEDAIKQEVRELYFERMDKLIGRNLFVHKSTADLAKHLAEISKMKLELLTSFNLNRNLDIFRIINHLKIDDLIQKMECIEPLCVVYHDDDGFYYEDE